MFIEGGLRLKEERKRLKMNQDQMAQSGGIAKSTYCNYEAGVRAPDAIFLTNVAKSGADVGYIITGRRTQEPIDKERLSAALRAVEEGLSTTNKTMPHEKKADLIIAVYDLLGEEDQTETILKLVKLAA